MPSTDSMEEVQISDQDSISNLDVVIHAQINQDQYKNKWIININ